MGAILGQPPESTLQNQGRQVPANIAAIDELAEAFARSVSSPLQAPELPVLLQGSPRLVPRIRLTYRQESDPVGDDGLPNEWTEELGCGGGGDRGTLELDLDNHERITTLNADTGTGVDQLDCRPPGAGMAAQDYEDLLAFLPRQSLAAITG